MKSPGEIAGLVCMVVGVLIFCFGVFMDKAKADNMVCRDNNTTQIYIETDDIETPINEGLKKLGAIRSSWVSMANLYHTVRFHNRDELRISTIIPCVMIVEKKNVTTSLETYLDLTKSQ